MRKSFPSWAHFFYPPNLEENEEGKVMRNVFYTNTPILLHSSTPLTFLLLYNKDIIVNLYKLYFSSSHFFSPTKQKKFPPSHFSIPPIKYT